MRRARWGVVGVTGTSEASVEGGCLCGAVSYSIAGDVGPVLHCHCENCRRLTGNFVAASRVATSALEVAGDDASFAWHHLDYAQYGFCRACGSTLFFRAAETPEITSVMVGTMNDTTGLEVGAVWFAHEAQPHHQLPEGVPHHDGNA